MPVGRTSVEWKLLGSLHASPLQLRRGQAPEVPLRGVQPASLQPSGTLPAGMQPSGLLPAVVQPSSDWTLGAGSSVSSVEVAAPVLVGTSSSSQVATETGSITATASSSYQAGQSSSLPVDAVRTSRLGDAVHSGLGVVHAAFTQVPIVSVTDVAGSETVRGRPLSVDGEAVAVVASHDTSSIIGVGQAGAVSAAHVAVAQVKQSGAVYQTTESSARHGSVQQALPSTQGRQQSFEASVSHGPEETSVASPTGPLLGTSASAATAGVAVGFDSQLAEPTRSWASVVADNPVGPVERSAAPEQAPRTVVSSVESVRTSLAGGAHVWSTTSDGLQQASAPPSSSSALAGSASVRGVPVTAQMREGDSRQSTAEDDSSTAASAGGARQAGQVVDGAGAPALFTPTAVGLPSNLTAGPAGNSVSVREASGLTWSARETWSSSTSSTYQTRSYTYESKTGLEGSTTATTRSSQQHDGRSVDGTPTSAPTGFSGFPDFSGFPAFSNFPGLPSSPALMAGPSGGLAEAPTGGADSATVGEAGGPAWTMRDSRNRSSGDGQEARLLSYQSSTGKVSNEALPAADSRFVAILDGDAAPVYADHPGSVTASAFPRLPGAPVGVGFGVPPHSYAEAVVGSADSTPTVSEMTSTARAAGGASASTYQTDTSTTSTRPVSGSTAAAFDVDGVDRSMHQVDYTSEPLNEAGGSSSSAQLASRSTSAHRTSAWTRPPREQGLRDAADRDSIGSASASRWFDASASAVREEGSRTTAVLDASGWNAAGRDASGWGAATGESRGWHLGERESGGLSSSLPEMRGWGAEGRGADGWSAAGRDASGWSAAGRDTSGSSATERDISGWSATGRDGSGRSAAGGSSGTWSAAGRDDSGWTAAGRDASGRRAGGRDASSWTVAGRDASGWSAAGRDAGSRAAADRDASSWAAADRDVSSWTAAGRDSSVRTATTRTTGDRYSAEPDMGGVSSSLPDTDTWSAVGRDTSGSARTSRWTDGSSSTARAVHTRPAPSRETDTGNVDGRQAARLSSSERETDAASSAMGQASRRTTTADYTHGTVTSTRETSHSTTSSRRSSGSTASVRRQRRWTTFDREARLNAASSSTDGDEPTEASGSGAEERVATPADAHQVYLDDLLDLGLPNLHAFAQRRRRQG